MHISHVNNHNVSAAQPEVRPRGEQVQAKEQDQRDRDVVIDLVRQENLAASRNPIKSREQAASLAGLLRTQVAVSPDHALAAHGNLSSQSIAALLG